MAPDTIIDIPTLRKLSNAPTYAPPAVFANACGAAADAMADLCKQIDGTVRVAADALARVKERDAEIERLRAVLLDWRKTPGNQRTATWWHNWLKSLDDALGYEQSPRLTEPDDNGRQYEEGMRPSDDAEFGMKP